jgi:hypothetical protein
MSKLMEGKLPASFRVASSMSAIDAARGIVLDVSCQPKEIRICGRVTTADYLRYLADWQEEKGDFAPPPKPQWTKTYLGSGYPIWQLLDGERVVLSAWHFTGEPETRHTGIVTTPYPPEELARAQRWQAGDDHAFDDVKE